MLVDLKPYDDGGTPGISWYQEFMRCPKSAQQTNQGRTNGSTRYHSRGTTIGTVGHAYAQYLYLGELTDDTLEFTPTSISEYNSEFIDLGHQVGSRYVFERKAYEFGEIVSVESRFILDEKDYKELGQPVFIPFSGQADLLTRLSVADCNRIRAEFGVELIPGLWVIDHKFYSRKSSTVVDEITTSIQLEAYRRLAQLLNPNEEVVGALGNITYYYNSKSNPRNEYLIIPVIPSMEMEKVLTQFWNQISREMEYIFKTGKWEANYTGCTTQYGLCKHFLTGKCLRY